jgi:phage tail sheath protein FI
MNESAIATPGVYINEISTLPPSIAQVSTAIPAFIGYTEKAEDENGLSLTGKPTKIFSLKEYEQYFGKAENETVTVDVTIITTPVASMSAVGHIASPSKHNMYYSMRLYFDNGGGPCYIVSVGASSVATVLDTDLQTNGLDKLEAFDEPTIYVIPEGQNVSSANLYYGLIKNAINQCAKLQDRFTLVDVYDQSSASNNTNITNFRGLSGLTTNDNLNYAAAYYPNLKTNYDFQYLDSATDVTVTTDGIAALPVKLDTLLISNSAAYYTAKNAIRKLSPTLPPTPAIAGIYVTVDATRGVWKAPANVSVNGIYDVTHFITDDEQGPMNIDPGPGKSVNAIRPFNGKGILVWGARTLDGNSSEWRYISVRRFFIMVEESTKKATAHFVFEPNDANTWTKIRAMIENYLTLLWRDGALAGSKPEQAFFVKCGLGQTMTAQDILDGKLIVEIGMAAVRPAEFIILRFMHKLQEA